jgi:hypothetical protein
VKNWFRNFALKRVNLYRYSAVTPEGEKAEEERINKVFIGKVPIMLRSEYCSLHDHTDKELTELGECPYDEVGGGGRGNGELDTQPEPPTRRSAKFEVLNFPPQKEKMRRRME